MFELQGRYYQIEYEGLHMLCLSCGKFGHYIEGCPDNGKKQSWNEVANTIQQAGGEVSEGGVSAQVPKEAGPWVVVQKPRRARRPKDSGPAQGGKTSADLGASGSRSQALDPITNEEAHGKIDGNDLGDILDLSSPRVII